MYGYWQYFRPQPGLQNQVYRFNPETGALTIVADGFVAPNGRLSRKALVKLSLLTLPHRPHILSRWTACVRNRHWYQQCAFRVELYPSSFHVSYQAHSLQHDLIIGLATVSMSKKMEPGRIGRLSHT
jgi:hypothetical protein